MTGKQFKYLRQQLGMTQRQIANHFEVTERTIWTWESGRAPVPRLAEIALRALIRAGNVWGLKNDAAE